MHRALGEFGGSRKALASLLCLALVTAFSGLGLVAQETATLSGIVVEGTTPLPGYIVEIKDVKTGQSFFSQPTDAAGRYSVAVPTGGRYQPVAFKNAATGFVTPIKDVPPIPVNVAGNVDLNLRIPAQPPSVAAEAVATTTAAETKPAKEAGKKRWWETPAGITVLAVGGVGAAALLLQDDDDEPTSPSK